MRTQLHPSEIDLAIQRIRPHVVPALVIASVLIGIYLASVFLAPGLLTYLLTVPALLIISMTALARVNDLGMEQVAKRWQVRRLGLVMAAAGALMLALVPAFTGEWPSWRQVMFQWGVAFTWITTPHMPPWWRYITGQYRTIRDEKLAAVAPLVSGLDPRDDAPQYAQTTILPPGVLTDRRRTPELPEDGP